MNVMAIEELEKVINYEFRNKKLLLEAITHPSMSFNQTKKFNYERLEFLGDSILSFVVAEYTFLKHSDEREGGLSKRKSFLVSKNILYSIAKSLNLGKFIILAVGEENNGGRNKVSNLENVLEAIIGAIYLDSDVNTVKKFILNLWSKIDDVEQTPPEPPKTRLQIWTQKYFKCLPKYDTVNIGDDRHPFFSTKLSIEEVEMVEATGNSIKEAENAAADAMLNNILEF